METNPQTWLLLLFSLPAKNASQRVDVWRRLKRYGAIPLRGSGYLLPKTPLNEERFQWIATEIRKHKGEGSVLEVLRVNNLHSADLIREFNDARMEEYEPLANELQKLLKSGSRSWGLVSRLRRRYQEIASRDFFHAPLGRRVEQLLFKLDSPESGLRSKVAARRKEYSGKSWVTRPRPGIDRVSSAWLIRRFIDPKAMFLFAKDGEAFADAIPFDMFTGKGFSHRGDDCTFETLMKEFGLRDKKVSRMAQAVHDADLADEKFGRAEALGIDQVLIGWANQGMRDDQILQRGMELIEGLYQAL
jgi:hypothetical protein